MFIQKPLNINLSDAIYEIARSRVNDSIEICFLKKKT